MCIRQAIDSIRNGDFDSLKQLVVNHPEIKAARDETGLSLVMLACYCRQPQLVVLLLADREEKDLDIFEAAALGHAERMAELCRDRSRLVGAWSSDGFQPLHLAAFFAQPACVQVLLELGANADVRARNDSKVRPIHSALAGRDRTVIRLLVEHGAMVNVQQHGGWTPLHAAAMHGDDETVNLLLAHGADLYCRSDDGKTAADLAAQSGHHAIASRLR